MAYPAKKPFGSTRGKPFKKFDRKPFSSAQSKPFGTAQGKPFRAKSAWGSRPQFKKPFGAKPGFGSSRSATRIGESAPRRTGGFGSRPSFKGGVRKESDSKWKRPYGAGSDSRPRFKKPEQKTSWGAVAGWYHDSVEASGSYQRELILPNLLRLMDIKKGEVVLDLACGEGFFSRAFATAGARVIGADIAPELIALAKKQSPAIDFHVAPADKVSFVKNESVDKVAIVLALQNIDSFMSTLTESARVTKKSGKVFIVLNHPAFRIPQGSSWGFDHEKGVQYRRVDSYISESRVEIQMHPGENPAEKTISFHRPLQLYVKALKKAGFAITGLEEWTSHKTSEPGPRQEAENKARKEFPMFLLLEATKI